MRHLKVKSKARRIGESVEFARMREEWGDQVVDDPASYPCEYSPKQNPHSPLVEGEYACDGYGNMLNHERNEIQSQKCRCYREWLERRWAGGYARQLTREVNDQLMMLSTTRFALAEVLKVWNWKTKAVLISGPPGIGKSLAGHYVIQQQIQRRHVEGVYWNCETIADDLRRIGLGDDEEKRVVARRIIARMDSARNPNTAILLDDLGRERDSIRSRDEIASFITRVYERRGIFVVTTNMAGKEMIEHYGEHVVDRLCDAQWCTPVRIESHKSGRREHLWD